MAVFRITYLDHLDQKPEEIEADEMLDDADWIDFNRNTAVGADKVLRVRAEHVHRVDKLAE